MDFRTTPASSSTSTADDNEIQQQLYEYGRFIQDVLQPQLVVTKSLADDVRSEIANYEDLGQRLDRLIQQQQHQQQEHEQPPPSPPLTSTMVDLGYEAIFCPAVIHDTNKVFVNVGMGFHVEMTIDTAKEFVMKRISFLKGNKLLSKERKEVEIMDHIQSATIILNQLQTELQRSSRR
jgi:hypothetical protein